MLNPFLRIKYWWRRRKHCKYLKKLDEKGIYVVHINRLNKEEYKCRFNSLPQAIDHINFYTLKSFNWMWTISHLEVNGKIIKRRDITNNYIFEEKESARRKLNMIKQLGDDQ